MNDFSTSLQFTLENRYSDSGARVAWVDVFKKIIADVDSATESLIDSSFAAQRLRVLSQSIKKVWTRSKSPTDFGDAPFLPLTSRPEGSFKLRTSSSDSRDSTDKAGIPVITTSSAGSEKSQSYKAGSGSGSGKQPAKQSPLVSIPNILGDRGQSAQLQGQQSLRASANSQQMKRTQQIDGQAAGGAAGGARLGAGLPGIDVEALMQLQLKYDKSL